MLETGKALRFIFYVQINPPSHPYYLMYLCTKQFYASCRRQEKLYESFWRCPKWPVAAPVLYDTLTSGTGKVLRVISDPASAFLPSLPSVISASVISAAAIHALATRAPAIPALAIPAPAPLGPARDCFRRLLRAFIFARRRSKVEEASTFNFRVTKIKIEGRPPPFTNEDLKSKVDYAYMDGHPQPQMTTHISVLGHLATYAYMGGQPRLQNDHPYKCPWPPDQVHYYRVVIPCVKNWPPAST